MGEEKGLVEAVNKLNKVIAALAVKGEERDQQIKILSGLGFSQKEMADIIGIDPSNISRAVSSIKGKSKEKTDRTDDPGQEIQNTEAP